jgi:hypothetical protein
MPADETLQVLIGDRPLQCRSVDDKMVLEPIGGILADGSTEGYRLEELDRMMAVLRQYDRPEELQRLRSLVDHRRKSATD